MKNSIKILITVLVLIILGGSFYIYKIKKDNNTEPFVPIVSNSTENKTLTDEQFIKISEDPEAKVLARGDINKDGFEDAIVAETFCGASCSVNLVVVLNQNNKTTKLVDEGRFEGYTAGTALQSDVQEITIVDGTISITGKGLDCGYTCTEENWDIIKTLKYELIDNNIVRLPIN